MEVLLGTFDGFMQNCDLQIDSFRAYLLEFLELQVSGVHNPFLFPDPPGRYPGGTPCGPGGRRPRSLFLEPEAPVPQPPPLHISLGGDRLDLASAGSKGLFLGLQPQVLEGGQSPGDSGGTSGKVSDGATRPSLLFGERRTSPLKGLQTRSDWRAPEPGRDAALWRSAGATGRGLAGRRRKSGSGVVERPFGKGTLSPQRLGAGVARSLLASRNVRGVLRLSRRTRAASPPHVRFSLCVGTGGIAPARSG